MREPASAFSIEMRAICKEPSSMEALPFHAYYTRLSLQLRAIEEVGAWMVSLYVPVVAIKEGDYSPTRVISVVKLFCF